MFCTSKEYLQTCMRAEWANERVIQMSVIQNADNKVL